MNRALAVVAVVGLTSALSEPARADTGMCAYMHELVQRGQAVDVSFVAEDWKYQCIEAPHHITRDDGTEVVDVIVDRVFSLDEGSDHQGPACSEDTAQACAEGAPECVDCDGDGTAECSIDDPMTFCTETVIFTVTDECVPPGHYTYRLLSTGFVEAALEIDVTDSGDACLGAEAEAAGCSVAPTLPSLGGAVPALMLLAGLLLAGFSRRRR